MTAPAKPLRVLVACEFSGRVRDAFIALGHDAISCDILPTEAPGPHHQGDVLEYLRQNPGQFDLMIAHPDCTYLANSGVQHLHNEVTGPERLWNMQSGAEFFNELLSADIPHICIENPIQHKYARELIRPYDQIVQPWHFGDRRSKSTCLWLKGLNKLIPSDVVGPPPRKGTVSAEEYAQWHEIHHASPGPDRGKRRSVTYAGIARAIAEQFSNQLK